MTATSAEPPILIVGAGPTGLTLAIALTAHGIPVRVLDHKHAPTTHSKATGLGRRSRSTLVALGVGDRLEAESVSVHSIDISDIGLPTRRVELASGDVLSLGQDRLEQILADALLAAGVPVEWGTRVVGVLQSDSGVEATTTTARGAPERRVTAGWIVGCDGPSGRTRASTALRFDETPTGATIRKVDCRLNWSRGSDPRMWFFRSATVLIAVAPLPDGMQRITRIAASPESPAGEPTLPEMQDALATAAADPTVRLTDLRWSRTTDVSLGIAPALHDGRVLLAGDAGGSLVPAGSRCLAMGIADAAELAQTLAMHLRQGAPATVLTSAYGQQRLAARARLQAAQRAALSALVQGDAIARRGTAEPRRLDDLLPEAAPEIDAPPSDEAARAS